MAVLDLYFAVLASAVRLCLYLAAEALVFLFAVPAADLPLRFAVPAADLPFLFAERATRFPFLFALLPTTLPFLCALRLALPALALAFVAALRVRCAAVFPANLLLCFLAFFFRFRSLAALLAFFVYLLSGIIYFLEYVPVLGVGVFFRSFLYLFIFASGHMNVI